MKNCNEIKEIISLYIDDELDSKLRNEFENHIKSCDECRIELEELQQIVELCGSITEEELPEGFKLQLHEKLLSVCENNDLSSVATKETNKTKLFKYVRIGSSIAAVLLIAVMLKVLFPFSGMADKATEAAPAAESALSSAATQPVENKAGKSDAADYTVTEDRIVAKDQYGDTSENVTITSGEADIDKGNLRKAEEPASKEAPKESIVPKTKSTEPEKQKEELQGRAASQTQLFAAMVVVDNAIRDTDITVKVENPAKEVDALKAKALEFGAEFREFKATDGAGDDVKNGSGSTDLVFKMPYEQYNSFVVALKTTIGSDFVSTEAINEIKIDEQIKEYQTKLNDLNNKINELEAAGTASDDEELNKLSNERDTVQKDLDYLMHDSKYISVCIKILAK